MNPLKLDRRTVELACFGAVGLAASLTHFGTAIWLIEHAGLGASRANILAFLAALPISYVGHAFFTFSAKRYGRGSDLTRQSAGRFVVLAMTGFLLNQASVVLFVETLGCPPRIVFGLTILGVAGFLFIASKFWAFRGSSR
ncbi:MAG: hypothetical protein VR74_17765 [Hyphomonas sp. BRH_c22]|uniref:GtrA family protein n=1 Tax=Hyphomonas sp. BRH_c22 TaxID=1629710 RepID=UPI0005F25DCE|nr:GtrA family protein [Hyphomonas sp. BRH_c22]KJS35200.1 MAG: hypothetical protein VR74_17765 [Hyphomonas sp. BRH_c22]